MQTNTKYIELLVPYSMRHLRQEIKDRRGRYDGETKLWTLEDTEENRVFAAQFVQPPKASVPAAERIKSVAVTCTELLNGLRVGKFRLTESSATRIVIEGSAQA